MITQILSQVDTWIGGEERLSDFTPGLLDGGSVVQAPASNGGTWFVVDSIIKEGVLNVLIAATTDQKGSGRTIDHTVTLADGRAVPDWLRVVRGSLIGQPPAGLPFIDIRIQTVDEGGKLLEGQAPDRSAERRDLRARCRRAAKRACAGLVLTADYDRI